jgi:predicted nucleic-acid-binding Zn-ribbon protein
MKANEMCPKCRSRKLFVVKELGSELAEQGKIVPMPVAIALRSLGGSSKLVQAGHFEAWVCAKCGLTELYANQLAALEKLAATSSAVRLVEHPAEAEPEPYR